MIGNCLNPYRTSDVSPSPIEYEWEVKLSDKLSPPEAVVEGLKAKYGDVWILRSSIIDVVVKMPEPAQFDAFTMRVMDEKQKPHAPKILLNDCMVWPERKDYLDQIKKRPGVAVKLQAELANLCGLDEEVRVEKP